MTDPGALPQFPVEGGCLCGAARYRLNAAPLGVYRCHCKDCQRTSGAAWSVSMIVARDSVEKLTGELDAYRKTADSGRQILMFGCPACSTRLWNEPLSAPDILILKPGTLDDAGWARPVGDIWTASRLPWVEIDESTPNYPGGATPNRDALIAAWQAAHGETPQ